MNRGFLVLTLILIFAGALPAQAKNGGSDTVGGGGSDLGARFIQEALRVVRELRGKQTAINPDHLFSLLNQGVEAYPVPFIHHPQTGVPFEDRDLDAYAHAMKIQLKIDMWTTYLAPQNRGKYDHLILHELLRLAQEKYPKHDYNDDGFRLSIVSMNEKAHVVGRRPEPMSNFEILKRYYEMSHTPAIIDDLPFWDDSLNGKTPWKCLGVFETKNNQVSNFITYQAVIGYLRVEQDSLGPLGGGHELKRPMIPWYKDYRTPFDNKKLVSQFWERLKVDNESNSLVVQLKGTGGSGHYKKNGGHLVFKTIIDRNWEEGPNVFYGYCYREVVRRVH